MKDIRNDNKFIFLSYISLFIVFLILLFGAGGLVNNKFFLYIPVQYSIPLIVFLEVLALIFVLSNNKNKIDFIFILLLFQLVIYTISLEISSNFLSAMPYYLSAVQAIVLYVFCLKMPVEKLNKLFLQLAEVSILIISIQLLSVWRASSSIGSIFYLPKVYISIPIGNSNYIACFINIFLVVVLNLEKKEKKKIIFIIFSILSIIGTESKAGLSIMIFILSFEYIIKVFKTKNVKEYIKLFVIIVAFSILIIFLSNYLREKLGYYIDFLNNIFDSGDTGIETASNGRLALYSEAVRMFLNKPILGYGMTYSQDLGMLAHNIIFDRLLKAGILNLFIFIFYIVIMLKRLIKYRTFNNEINASFKILIVALINSMIEPNIGSFSYDFFFWIFCGIGMANYYKIKKLINE